MNQASQAPASAPIKIRAHHLLCALTFRGRGYGPEFVLSFKQLIDQLIAGLAVQLINTPDRLCQAKQNCGLCEQRQSEQRDKIALLAIQDVVGVDERCAIKLEPQRLEQLRQAFADDRLRGACTHCAWFDFCSSIAQDNFRRARLQLPR